ncbi:MAG: DUF1501 domain-containing protein [Pirellulaceae bacterium]|nr:DUF1501 domain-containing protein [Pirellulaceae bacterium]
MVRPPCVIADGRCGAVRVGSDRVFSGSSCCTWIHEQRSTNNGQPRINSCILVFYCGGPSHVDSFDQKPKAPAEIRGEFKLIATAVPGIHLGTDREVIGARLIGDLLA